MVNCYVYISIILYLFLKQLVAIISGVNKHSRPVSSPWQHLSGETIMTTLRLPNFVNDIDISSAVYGIVQRIEAASVKVLDTLAIWEARSQERQQLSKLSDRMLVDIGLTRDQVAVEVGKYFWQQ
jgi:uncharacterized protein YjiS (DUF1127 family)